MRTIRLRLCVVFGAAITIALVAPPGAPAQAAAAPDSAAGGRLQPPTYPSYVLERELAIGGTGAGLAVSALLVSADIRTVPDQGLDAANIAWSVDRSTLGHLSSGADRLSDFTRDGAVVYPFVLAWLTSSDARWSSLGRRGLLYAEAFWVTSGLTYLTKRLVGRPRPFTYATSAERAESPGYDVSRGSAFESMPSGHASSAFVGVGLSVTEHLLSRPAASGLERFGIAALGGALGGATAALRVQAGKHFPTDVLAGAGIGLATGTAIPLLHRGERAWPTRRAWLEAAGGLLVGVVIGAAASSAIY